MKCTCGCDIRCPLHNAAPELYAALHRLVHFQPLVELLAPSGTPGSRLDQARDALKLANKEGAHGL